MYNLIPSRNRVKIDYEVIPVMKQLVAYYYPLTIHEIARKYTRLQHPLSLVN